MAAIRYESFDYMDINGAADITAALLASGGFNTVTNAAHEQTNHRTGRGGVNIVGGGTVEYQTPADQDELIFGFHMRLSTGAAGVSPIFRLEYNDGISPVSHVEFERDATNAVVCKQGDGTVLGTSAAGVITLQSHNFFEFQVNIHDTTGSVVLYVDASPSPILNLTGIDTRNGSSAIVNQIVLRNGGGSGGTVYDNFRVWDTTGALHNTITGVETELLTLLPDGAGDVTDWTPTGAATNWEAVDDPAAPDEDTTYVESSTIGHQDLYNMEDLPTNRTNVRGLQISDWARRTAGGGNNQKLLVKSNGSVGTGSEQTLAGTWRNQHQAFDADPFDGLEWTVARVNSHQAGEELT